MAVSAVEETLRLSMIDMLGVISRWGSTVCMDRATRLYLSPFPENTHLRIKLLEDLSYRFLITEKHDPRIDCIYDFLAYRVREMSDRARTSVPAE